MTCTEKWSSCNGLFLLGLALLAIAFNLTPLVADYVEDGRPFYNSISCYEWWLPGLVGGGLLVLPAVSMTLAARKNKSCNNRIGMLSSSLLCVVSIIGSAYCTLISIYALSKGPLICEKGSNTLDHCDYTLGNLSNIQTLTFDLAWFLNDTCIPTSPADDNVTAFFRDGLPNFVPDFEIDERSQKIIHITVFAGLATVGLLQMIVALSQIVSGFFGCICGTSKFKKNRHNSSGNDNRGYKYYNDSD
ncbi:transmembrane 4 L6 family member 20 isoform X2 [Hyla sarda]|uniref:transmembrane 4 L6 family member 20 isoform X2 n=1 Tax=Hyla sarda TaxID=327740 RepID=UPI0024C4293E|nr:transmembrane 4 L6 family member 20 isoform X2 [Hyla sarda]